MATLKRFLGTAWDAELADTWSQAYGLIAKVMVAAAEHHEDVAPAIGRPMSCSVERRSIDVAVVEVVPRQPFAYRAGQSVAVEIPQRPRLGATSARRTPRTLPVICNSTSSRSPAAWCPPRWYAT